MKKAIWIFILLIIAAGVVFYFGWERIEPETFGLAHSTITGTIDFPLESGNLYWFWQKLIPKSFHVYRLKREPYGFEFEIGTVLPKSENLTDFGSFTLRMKTSVKYRIDFESAKLLFSSGLLSGFHEFFLEEVSSLASEAASTFVVEGMTRYTYSVRTFDYTMLDDLKKNLEKEVQKRGENYRLQDVDVIIIYTEIPQLDIYVEALKRFYQHLENAYLLKEKEFEKQSEYRKKELEEDIEIARLRKYGDLFSEFPVLLKYLYIEKFGERAEVVVIPQEERTGFPPMLETEPEKGGKVFLPEVQAPKAEEEEMRTGEQEAIKPEPEQEPLEIEPEGIQKKKKWYEHLKFWNALKVNGTE